MSAPYVECIAELRMAGPVLAATAAGGVGQRTHRGHREAARELPAAQLRRSRGRAIRSLAERPLSHESLT
jgi:hypothetical protein